MTIKRYKHQADRRKARVRGKLLGFSTRPRLTVFRSNKHIYAQIIDDQTKKTLAQASDLKSKAKATKIDSAKQVGADLAQRALKLKLKQVVFDRGHYQFHGRIKALANAARDKGLDF